MKRLLILLCLLLFISGCGQVHGLSLSLGSFERGLWADADKKNVAQKPSWGLKCDITMGQWLRPVGGKAPWRGGEPIFVLRSHIPLPGVYLGAHVGDCGFYVGTKTYEVADKHKINRYEKWMLPEEFGTDEKPKVYLCPTASWRLTRWH